MSLGVAVCPAGAPAEELERLWCGVAWRGVRGVRGVRDMAWRGVAWRGVAWRGVAWRGVARRGVSLHETAQKTALH